MTIENVRQVKAVWNGDEWELHIVCKHEIEADSPGDKTAGIDLGISNFAAVSYSTGDHELYPGNALKTDERYFAKEIAKCNSSRSNKALRLRKKRSERRSHYLHAVTKHIVTECVERGIGTIAVGNSKASVKTTKLVRLATGVTVATRTCTGGRSTASRTCSRTKRKPKASPSL